MGLASLRGAPRVGVTQVLCRDRVALMRGRQAEEVIYKSLPEGEPVAISTY